jgi:hypothetical protein
MLVSLVWPEGFANLPLCKVSLHHSKKCLSSVCAAPVALNARGWYEWAGPHWIVQTPEHFFIALCYTLAIRELRSFGRLKFTLLLIMFAFEQVVQRTRTLFR